MDNKYTIIGTRNNQGFFTNFFHTLQHLKMAELEERIPIVYWVGGAYATKKKEYNGIKTENIWEYYFEPVSEYKARDILPKTKVNKYGQLKFSGKSPWDSKKPDVKIRFRFHDQGFPHEPKGCWDTEIYPPEICLNNPNREGRVYIKSIIDKYIRIKTYITAKADRFFYDKMSGREVLGVHIRGCNDHEAAQGVNPVKRYIKYAKKYLEEHENSYIFVATDCAKSLSKMRERFGDRVLYREVIRSKDRNPVQYGRRPKRQNKAGGPKAGEEVIIDALLLAKCDYILRGFSNVPSCASFMNPDVGMTYVCKYDDKLKKYLGLK